MNLSGTTLFTGGVYVMQNKYIYLLLNLDALIYQLTLLKQYCIFAVGLMQ